jgi:hypothetical protein
LRCGSLSFFTVLSFSASAVGIFTGSGSLAHTYRLSLWLEGPIELMPQCPVVLLVVTANIVGPPCRLHEQHKALIGK